MLRVLSLWMIQKKLWVSKAFTDFYICCDLDMIFTKIESARAIVGPENS